ncbi:MAG: nitrogenase component 1 [Theionarchaea archaeon]|nr:nitrogenase component 1 [Theionarchaea archaeon]
MKEKDCTRQEPFRGTVTEFSAWRKSTEELHRVPVYHPVRVCALFGALRVMGGITDGIALTHGPAGCAFFQKFQISSCFGHDLRTPCTAMSDSDAVYGGEDTLKESLLEADRRYNPKLIAVLNTCTPQIIGDDVDAVIDSVAPHMGCKYVFSVPADGLQYYTQSYGYNEALVALIEQVFQHPKEKTEKSVNLFGEIIPGMSALGMDKYILRDLLKRIGVRVQAIVTAGSSVAQLEQAPRAQANVPRCGLMRSYASARMESRFGIPTLDTIMPYGIKNTSRWLLKIAEFFDLTDRAEDVIEKERKKLAPLLTKATQLLEGKTVAVNGGPGRAPAFLRMADELGCTVVLFNMFFGNDEVFEQVERIISEIDSSPLIMVDASMDEVRTTAEDMGVDIWFGDALDFPNTYTRMALPSFETLIYQKSFEGFEGCKNLLKHIIHRTVMPTTPVHPCNVQRCIQ